MSSLKVDISLTVNSFNFNINEIFTTGITGVFGNSGAGKTTLMQCISGVGLEYSGSISVGDKIISSTDSNINTPTHKRHVAYVFQEGRLFPHYTVKKNLLYGQRFLKNRSSKIAYEDVINLLELDDLLSHYPANISGGQRQRVALGRALLANPEVLLLDEPFSALDQKLRNQIIPFLDKIATNLNIPILLVSHDLPDILKLTNKLCIIKNGTVVAHDLFENLIQQKELSGLLPFSEILNVIELAVKDIDESQGIITLNGMGASQKVNILFEPNKQQYKLNEVVRVFLKPDDIVLATQQINHTSFRNQLKGTIKQIHNEGAKTMCLVDCGFPLICEVSRASINSLNLNIGSAIYCLFKTLALDSIKI